MTVSAVEYTVILWHENLQFIFVGSKEYKMKTRSSDQVVLFVVPNYDIQIHLFSTEKQDFKLWHIVM